MKMLEVLISVMKELVHRGNSVIIVEHNLDVIVSSDYVIDLGPQGGKNGGQIICEGTPYALSEDSTHLLVES